MRIKATKALSGLLSLALATGLALPALAWADTDDEQAQSNSSDDIIIPELFEDQTPLTQEEIDEAFAQGSVDLSSIEDTSAAANSRAATSYRMLAYSGSNRYETSALQAKQWSSTKNGTVVIANGATFPDALTASSLAGALECPVLLVPPDNLVECSKSALQHLKSIGVTQAILIGGTSALSSAIPNQLSALGITAKTRLAGANRYATQMEIFKYGQTNGFWDKSLVLLASGNDAAFGDALSASPVAYRLHAPIFLVGADSKTLDSQQHSLLQAAGTFARTLAVGGTARIAESELNFMKSISTKCERANGANRYETSANLASKALSEGWLNKNNAALATGSAPWDALGGGALQGKDASLLLLVNEGPTQTVANILSGASSVRIFGGKAAVSSAVRLDLADRLSIPYKQIEGFKVYIDAGHGQNSSNNGAFDPGACANGYREADLTQEIANKTATALRALGVNAYVNTSGWYKLRHPQAVALDCDMVVSIHFNSGGGTGSESYIHSRNASWKSADLQTRLHSALTQSMNLNDRGKKKAQLAVVSGKLPACLLEICFIDNQSDLNRYAAQKQQLADALANAIAR